MASQLSYADNISLQLKWKHQFQFAGYYAALSQGYYQQEGLNVTLLEAKPSISPIQTVLNHSAEYGVGTSHLLLSRNTGKPVVVLGVIFQHSPFALVTQATANIQSIQDLRGKKIMLEEEKGEISALLQSNHLAPDQYLSLKHSFNIQDFQQGAIDAMSVYTTDEPFYLQKHGIPYHIFTPQSAGIDFYGDNLYTTEDEIKRHPKRVAAFMRASFKGWQYAMSHTDEIIDLLIHQYHVKKNRDALKFEASTMQALMQTPLIPPGYMYQKRWKDIVHTYQDLGKLPKNFSLDGFLYLPKNNLWDTIWQFRWQIFAYTLGLLLLSLALYNQTLRITVRKRTHALHEANASKTRFLATASHDLRQPLNALNLFLSALIDNKSPEDHKRILQQAYQSSQNLSELLTTLLDISQLDAHAIKPNPSIISLANIFQEMTREFQQQAEQQGLQWRVHNNLTDAYIQTDHVLFNRILRNLISNALKYTQQGGILLAARQRQQHIQIEVWDTGCGIPKNKLQYIFTEFYQVHPHHTGIGLGLSITQRLSKALHHPLTIRSTLGKGSCFSVQATASSPPKHRQSNINSPHQTI